MSQQPTSKDESGIFQPFHVDQVPEETFEKGDRFGITYRSLGDFGGGSHIGVSLEVIQPGKQAYPAHYHMLEEEHLMILEGSLTLILGEQEHRLEAGQYVCFPAGQKAAHALRNDGEQACRYLVIGERNPHDVIVYPESGRVGVRAIGEGYRKSETLEYWDGIRT